MRYKIGGIIVAVTIAGALLVLTTPWASGSSPQADLTVKQSASATAAARGATITFTSYALDLGPSSGSLFDTIAWTKGINVTDQTCQLVSPDTPSCEWNTVPPNVARRMTVKAQITGAVGTHAVLTVCASGEGDTVDPNSVDNCSTTFVKITAP
jgi:hypothetical protein